MRGQGNYMSKCVLVTEQGNTYEIQPGAEPENWQSVFERADQIEYLEDLTGWGTWTRAYRIQRGDETLTYFVEAKRYGPEARRALAEVYALLLDLAAKNKESIDEDKTQQEEGTALPTSE